MSLLRPEATAALIRWREVIAGAMLTLLGVWWASGSGLLIWLGGLVAVLGLALVAAGIQRGRFRRGAGGAGVVQVVEGQLAYFGPLGGGGFAIAAITRVSLSDGRWRIDAAGLPGLDIPVNAHGAEQLFDVFAALPGLEIEALIASVEAARPETQLLWERAVGRLH